MAVCELTAYFNYHCIYCMYLVLFPARTRLSVRFVLLAASIHFAAILWISPQTQTLCRPIQLSDHWCRLHVTLGYL